MVKVQNLNMQMNQMKQLAGQLKKEKDPAQKKVAVLEKDVVDTMTKIQVSRFLIVLFRNLFKLRVVVRSYSTQIFDEKDICLSWLAE